MKNKLVLSCTGFTALLSTMCYGGAMGDMQTNNVHKSRWVIGGDAGFGYLSTQEENLLAPVPNSIPLNTETQSQDYKVGHFIGGGYLGYNYSVLSTLLLGVEVGYKYLGQSTYHSLARDIISVNTLDNEIKVNQQAVDFLVTGKLYVTQNINFLAKAGPAYVRSQTKQDSRFIFTGISGELSTDAVIWRIKPEFALGVGYTFKDNMDLNLTYTHIGGVDTNVTGLYRFYNVTPDRTPAVFEYNGLTLGLSYTFG